ncbi:DNA-directed DNA polymerase [Acididesulfobacillus acetoxydans]|uniref:DNA polymerase I n=1 Tax=Acididesulfobacillus acetoxydans TaxID=1561005 RepID=A0A8S0WPX1_9FIRM|nr:DNA polymerase I [Acididesulfobacillus acetoxydans]CAA7602234.1 DNA-directed DNA polymerase [Acididesulfobacillus acetoxydans]CEJ07548.1 DNA polymerase I [Acididesulfobacillus acetoxydans]
MPRIVILDGNSLANRAFYALPMLTAADGRPTNVLHGFLTMLFRLQQEQVPDYWVVAFDKTKATVRIEQYAAYKAQRKATPEALRPQFGFLKEILGVLAVPILEYAGYEADDLIATVTAGAEERGWETLIYTGDRDALQLVSPRTTVFLTKKGISEVEAYDESALWERYELRPSQIIDLKGLMGDASDNIPGVPGIGEKTALKLLWQFGSVEETLNGCAQVSGKKLRQSLEDYAEQALLSKKLATMLKDVPVEFSLDEFVYRQPPYDRALKVLHDYDLRSVARLFAGRYGGAAGAGSGAGSVAGSADRQQTHRTNPAADSGIVTEGGFGPAGGALPEAGPVPKGGMAPEQEPVPARGSVPAFGAAAEPLSPEPAGIRPGEEGIPAAERPTGPGEGREDGWGEHGEESRGERREEHRVEHREQYPQEWPETPLGDKEWLEIFQTWAETGAVLSLAYRFAGASPHWGQWQAWAIAAAGRTYRLEKGKVSSRVEAAWSELLRDAAVEKVVVDYKALSSLLQQEGNALQGLRIDLSLGAYLLNSARTKFTPLDLVRDYFPQTEPFADLSGEAAALAQIWAKMEEELKHWELWALLKEVEEPLSPVLARMERTGLRVDLPQLESFGRELRGALKSLEQEIYEQAGEHFNINSTQQLGKILFEKMGLPPAKKTKTGYSTDAETLEELRAAHPLIGKILDYRQLNKLMSTYVNGLSAQVRDGLIHTTFQQTVTATGRLSSTEPNLQNIPVRLEYGRRLRRVFEPGERGWVLLSADYSQIELRILAHYSQDPLLCESFALGQDVHTRTAAEVFGLPWQEVTPELRRRAKAVNFGLVYGLTDFGLARDLGIPRSEAKYYIEQYFARYHGVKEYLEGVVAKAKEEGQVRTLLKRLRRIPELYHPSRTQRRFGERIAMNTPVQGTAADIMKLAMIGVAERLREYRADLLLQVHDELLVQVAPEELAEVSGILKEEMENALPLSVPLTVECKSGPNWYEMKPLD